MIPSLEREKMAAAGRKREQCWRELQPSIVAYAAAVSPMSAGFHFGNVKLAGNKHVPRVQLNLANCFEKLLPYSLITSQGKKRPFTTEQIYNNFQTAMFAIGVDIKSEYSPIVSIRHATTAIALFRLTGETYNYYSQAVFARAARVERILRDRQAKWKRIAKAEMEHYYAQKAVERAATGTPSTASASSNSLSAEALAKADQPL